MAEAVEHFTKDYKSFATAVDATRHELPVKNFYIDGDTGEFLGCCYYLLEVIKMLKLHRTALLLLNELV